MVRFLYSLAILLLLPWAVAHLLLRGRRQPEYLRHWDERFAHYGKVPRTDAPTIWLHAVSVGETRAAQPLVAALRERYPDHRILFTHMTPTGRETSLALFGDGAERIYLPYDTPWATRRFLRHFKPRLGLILETELWPNLVGACRKLGVPLYLVNARLSARSARRYARFAALSRNALLGLAGIGAQGTEDARRLAELGAGGVVVTGNLKFDISPPESQFQLGALFRSGRGQRKAFLAASTRDGEEALLLDAWRRLPHSASGPAGSTAGRALLVIVPRHPQRFAEVEGLARERGFRCQRRSAGTEVAADVDVLVGDSMGEMFAYYASADLAFIGGSLLDYGSQNLIEAAACGTPMLIGPSTRNFADAARAALACGAARPVIDAEDLAAQAAGLLEDGAALAAMGDAGREFAARHRGATMRTLGLIRAMR